MSGEAGLAALLDDPVVRRWVAVIGGLVALMLAVAAIVGTLTDQPVDRCAQLDGIRTSPTTCVVTVPEEPRS